MERSFRAGFFRLADPKISLASFAGIFLAAAAARASGPLHAGWLALTALGIFAIEVAKNASGEIVDWRSGTDRAVAAEDRSPFSGGKRVLVDGLLDERETLAIAAVSYAVGIAIGIAIAALRDPRVLWIGLAGVGLAYLYHAAPLRLAYRGFGEIAVALAYGPLICGGAYLVQTGRFAPEILALSLPLGLLVGAFLWINEFPDYRADLASGKRNLVVRLGRLRAARVFAAIVALAIVSIALLPLAGLPRGVWLGLAAALPAISATRILLLHPERTERVVPAQARTLVAFLLYAVGAGIGVLGGR